MFSNRITNPLLRGLVEWTITILLAVLLFFVLRTFLFRTASVTGNSMAHSINHGDMLIVNRLSYHFRVPRAGEIVAFPYQGNPSEVYVKRIIGVPGDVIDLQDGQFFVNGLPLADEFSYEFVLAIGDVIFPITVEDGRYFVLGDNRNNSRDSRFSSVGNVPRRDIMGHVVLRVLPVSGFGRVS